MLSTIFSSTARTTVLTAMLTDPTRAYYQRQVEAATGLPLRAVQRELMRLTKAQLLYRRAEGNRAYFQADTGSAFYGELRTMVLKAAPPVVQLRGVLAVEPAVRLAFLDGGETRVLVVGHGARRPTAPAAAGFSYELVSSDGFTQRLAEDTAALGPFLRDGCDLLGRRDDIIWRRIEDAGYAVPKGKGVP